MTSQYNSRCCEEERTTPFPERQVRKMIASTNPFKTKQNKTKKKSQRTASLLSLTEAGCNFQVQKGKSKGTLRVKFRTEVMQ
jgi:hypothetical protein